MSISTPRAYYNEKDPFAAAWLRELIAAGEIMEGTVDERDIKDVLPSDLAGFTRCHFFAGIGGWDLALQIAGWPEDLPVWTGSCPCQPFSAAGAGAGFDDERHLWPDWFWLVQQYRPDVVFGEQVEAAINHHWLDLVCNDLEGEGYAVGAVGLPAACVGAFHIRQRLWFVADAQDADRWGRERGAQAGTGADGQRRRGSASGGAIGDAGELADTEHAERGTLHQHREDGRDRADAGRAEAHGEPGTCGEVRQLADTLDHRTRRPAEAEPSGDGTHDGISRKDGTVEQLGHAGREGLSKQRGHRGISRGQDRTNTGQALERTDPSTPWADLIWLPCRDGKARPTQSGLFPLAHGVSNRVGILRGAGNAIVAPLAAEVIRAYMDLRDIR